MIKNNYAYKVKDGDYPCNLPNNAPWHVFRMSLEFLGHSNFKDGSEKELLSQPHGRSYLVVGNNPDAIKELMAEQIDIQLEVHESSTNLKVKPMGVLQDQDKHSPIRITLSREEFIDQARTYMEETYGKCSISDNKDKWLEHFGMLIDFIHNSFPTEARIYDKPKEPEIRYIGCERREARQHRKRLLTGSIGLEGPWSEWVDGVPERQLPQYEYEYRKEDNKGEI